ncbi:prephenate dehydratase [Corynebacterium guangdongense]|uniref:Prephenate dehydratase n=1 Tax=Corynebacterium guangdongense TaxID=1783348 RepID=A0ABU1ZZZ6_9CORY|nr:prephenate dehydratase [Corynebacterium guangdongense]MDR7330476.1 prephenate dehydratase [Corynebacterium guangdongense]WJZ19032.1 Prephenate dehydratase [Corynebacterium guangdongense]
MSTSVAYLGPAGTFTEAALTSFHARGAFGDAGEEITPIPVASPAAALDRVRAGEADYAVVAIENSVDGAVTGTFDALADGERVQIFSELELEIAFDIMVRPGTSLADATTFATHPVAHQQVRHWLKEHLPAAEYVPASSNAAAAQLVAEGKADVAAAPGRAAEIFGLETVATGIADTVGARTRFVVVGKPDVPPARTGNDTTLIVFTLPNTPGSLVHALQDFAQRGVSMSWIASRPNPGHYGTYRFYVDLDGHIDDIPLAEALRAVWLRVDDITFLGSWPATHPSEREAELAADIQRLHEATAWVQAARTGKDTD